MSDRIIIVLGSVTVGGPSVYAIFPSSREDLVTTENLEYLNEELAKATLVSGALHKALVLADHEADQVSLEDNNGLPGPLPGILYHRLSTCRISPDNLSIQPI